jgi:hypothetical protein
MLSSQAAWGERSCIVGHGKCDKIVRPLLPWSSHGPRNKIFTMAYESLWPGSALGYPTPVCVNFGLLMDSGSCVLAIVRLKTPRSSMFTLAVASQKHVLHASTQAEHRSPHTTLP